MPFQLRELSDAIAVSRQKPLPCLLQPKKTYRLAPVLVLLCRPLLRSTSLNLVPLFARVIKHNLSIFVLLSNSTPRAFGIAVTAEQRQGPGLGPTHFQDQGAGLHLPPLFRHHLRPSTHGRQRKEAPCCRRFSTLR